MKDNQIVIQLTIVVNGDGETVIKTTVDGKDATAGGGATGGTSGTGGTGTGGTGTGGTGTGDTGTGGSGPGPSGPPIAEVAAQRTVHIVGGNGGLAWFTLIWPAPAVITGFNPSFAYDDPAKAASVPGTGADHPLFVRKLDTRVLWDGQGAHPFPSIFVAGVNQTHTNGPQTTAVAGGTEVIAAGAALQGALAAPVPALSFQSALRYGPAPGAPAMTVVTSVASAIAAVKAVATLSSADEQSLTATDANLATWGITAATPAVLVSLAQLLWFTANAFRLGLVATVLMPAFNDDPHGAFAGGDTLVATRTEILAKILDGFYAELAAHPEPKGGHSGNPLSLADNVVLVVSGDTFKNSFNRNGWSDGTPGNSNLLYVRSNGYLKPGWFGSIAPTSPGRTNFDPTTGIATAGSPEPPATIAAQLGILFAISRGKTAAVTAVSAAPFAGVVANPLP